MKLSLVSFRVGELRMPTGSKPTPITRNNLAASLRFYFGQPLVMICTRLILGWLDLNH